MAPRIIFSIGVRRRRTRDPKGDPEAEPLLKRRRIAKPSPQPLPKPTRRRLTRRRWSSIPEPKGSQTPVATTNSPVRTTSRLCSDCQPKERYILGRNSDPPIRTRLSIHQCEPNSVPRQHRGLESILKRVTSAFRPPTKIPVERVWFAKSDDIVLPDDPYDSDGTGDSVPARGRM
ncbi:hypothetical protein P152DRAFT_452002 [Eremomyces bilateralis CBS 781.70]|uniref:Uncharacterized protein n=1 Tax=Eremomyces bilateralis CBS 781.70 TaxID=1392243 RepID=A0A6G1FUX7_9PEZI|nr:uncharacterized protein P152DRAFT_452002 [Eremomyces bilateralis CBS 781.70]KAF1809560.1 hypothetical protein P152DRAFT_452002 [Eremomyces bilateralis CBS 781.70]